jgi:hypothetical protein
MDGLINSLEGPRPKRQRLRTWKARESEYGSNQSSRPNSIEPELFKPMAQVSKCKTPKTTSKRSTPSTLSTPDPAIDHLALQVNRDVKIKSVSPMPPQTPSRPTTAASVQAMILARGSSYNRPTEPSTDSSIDIPAEPVRLAWWVARELLLVHLEGEDIATNTASSRESSVETTTNSRSLIVKLKIPESCSTRPSPIADGVVDSINVAGMPKEGIIKRGECLLSGNPHHECLIDKCASPDCKNTQWHTTDNVRVLNEQCVTGSSTLSMIHNAFREGSIGQLSEGASTKRLSEHKPPSRPEPRILDIFHIHATVIRPEDLKALPNINLSSNLQEELASASSDIQNTAALLLNTLNGVEDDEDLGANATYIPALKTALDDGLSEFSAFRDAMLLLASNKDLIISIQKDLDRFGGANGSITGNLNENTPSLSPDDEGMSLHSISSRNLKPPGVIMTALNSANALLYEMMDTQSHTYFSPYSRPLPAKLPTQSVEYVSPYAKSGLSSVGATPMPSDIEMTDSNRLDDVDGAAVDALLALANGGSLDHEDEDDKTIADTDETVDGRDQSPQLMELSDMPQTDIPVAHHLQRVINQAIIDRTDLEIPVTTERGTSIPYGQSVEEQAATLQTLLAEAGTCLNTRVPKAQGQVISQFYAHISSRAASISSDSRQSSPATAIHTRPQSQDKTSKGPKLGIFAQRSIEQRDSTPPGTSSSQEPPINTRWISHNEPGGKKAKSSRTRTGEKRVLSA